MDGRHYLSRMESFGYLLISGASRPSRQTGIQTCLCLNMHYIPKGKQINEYSHSIYSPGLRMHYSYICCRALGREDQHTFFFFFFSREMKVNFCEASLGKLRKWPFLFFKFKNFKVQDETWLKLYEVLRGVKFRSLFPSFPSQSHLLSELMLY